MEMCMKQLYHKADSIQFLRSYKGDGCSGTVAVRLEQLLRVSPLFGGWTRSGCIRHWSLFKIVLKETSGGLLIVLWEGNSEVTLMAYWDLAFFTNSLGTCAVKLLGRNWVSFFITSMHKAPPVILGIFPDLMDAAELPFVKSPSNTLHFMAA